MEEESKKVITMNEPEYLASTGAGGVCDSCGGCLYCGLCAVCLLSPEAAPILIAVSIYTIGSVQNHS